MLLGNLENWSNKRVWAAFYGLAVLFLALVLGGPIGMIAWKYDLFAKASEYRLTGWGMIIALTIGIVSVITIGFLVELLPENKPRQQAVKYFLQMLVALIIPVLFRYILYKLKVNFDLAYVTSCYCDYFIISGIFVYFTSLKSVIREIKLRHKAAELVEIEARKKYY